MEKRKLKVLCLHGFRTSGEIMRKQVMSRWPETVFQNLDLVFPNAPFPATGKSDVEGIFDPPYFEWFHGNLTLGEYPNFEACLEFLEDYMLQHGPFDGILGFSQGAILGAVLPGMKLGGVAITRVPDIKFLILISGAKLGGKKFGAPKIAATAFSSQLQFPSLHFIGELDFNKEESEALLECFVDPVVIKHPKGHTVPRLDETSMETVVSFINKIQET